MKEEFNQILSFCLSSAIGCVNEPPIYGPLRLIEVMEKIIDLGIKNGITTEDEMKGLSESIEKNKMLCMIDEKVFIQSLQEMSFLLIDQQMKRQ